MVGVGPGVGADVIRQRRKRADKLKKEQQVVVIQWVQMKFRNVNMRKHNISVICFNGLTHKLRKL